MEDMTLILLLGGLLLTGGLLFTVLSFRHGRVNLDKEKYRTKWLAVEQQLDRNEESSCHLAILNADKLLDQALKEKGMKGKTLADRMRSAANMFTSRDGVWTAHKLRNKIAHETDIKVTYDQTKYAIREFKRALKDIGAI